MRKEAKRYIAKSNLCQYRSLESIAFYLSRVRMLTWEVAIQTGWWTLDHSTPFFSRLLHLFVAQGLRPLSYAAAEILRDCGQLDVKEHRGKTPLLVAAAANQPKIVKDLILLGADINAMDQKGQTVLHFGATYGLPSLTPLHCAVMAHNAAFQTQNMEPLSQHHLHHLLLCIQRLLQLGADYKSQDLKSSKTILHLAVQAANLPLVQFLLKLPGQERQNFVNIKAHGNTALHMAAGLHGHPYQEQIVRLLLDHWADPTARNPENEQPVHLLTSGPAAEQVSWASE
uniref:NFKB inhibitor delta n=1 Tax=Naja naja TaxID=35670 RepID=A0A8C6Y0S8_NAJNA